MSENPSHRDTTIQRLIQKCGLRTRIDAKCCECIYDQYQPGTWRKQVENCASPKCPLFDVRPISKYKSSLHTNNHCCLSAGSTHGER